MQLPQHLQALVLLALLLGPGNLVAQGASEEPIPKAPQAKPTIADEPDPPEATPGPARRPIAELLDAEDTWSEDVEGWLKEAKQDVRVLPIDRQAGELSLFRAQVTQRAPMGAVALHTGGILVDHGWLHVLGGTGADMEGQDVWNELAETAGTVMDRGYYVVGWDVVGGVFVLNGGGLGPEVGSVWYLPPEDMNWSNLGLGYTDWLNWTLSGDVALFYKGFRWEGWEESVTDLDPDQMVAFYPPLFLSAGGAPRASRNTSARDYFARRLALRAAALRAQSDPNAPPFSIVAEWAKGATGPWTFPKVE